MICVYCKRIFCCTKCRLIHESKAHANEYKKIDPLPRKIHEDCHICKNQQFPLKLGESSEVFQHILEQHLPLKCSKCTKIFSKPEDFQEFGKCNKECNLIESGISDGTEKPIISDSKISTSKNEEDIDEKSLTPLSKINLRWRRKSKGFEPSTLLDSASVSEKDENKASPAKLTRQTSTPMPNSDAKCSTDPSYSTSSIQISSINCTSSTSSESDGCISPPVVQQVPSNKPINTPAALKRPNSNAIVTTRQRMRVQASPLRLVMTKSIQKALMERKMIKQYNYPGLQQRKVCFDSTGSSNESSHSEY